MNRPVSQEAACPQRLKETPNLTRPLACAGGVLLGGRRCQDKYVTGSTQPPDSSHPVAPGFPAVVASRSPQARDETTWWNARDVRHLADLMWARPVVRMVVYALLLLLAVRVFLWGTGLLASVILTVVAAYALAFLVNPILVWLEKRRVSRMIGVLLLLVVTIGVVTLLVMTLSTQISGLISGIPNLARNLKGVLLGLLDHLDSIPGAEGLKASLSKYIDGQTQQITQNAGPLLERVLNSGPSVLSTLSNLVGWLGQLGFIVTLAMYFMMDYSRVGLGVLHIFPRAWQPTLYQLSEDVSESFGGYIRGQLLLMLAGAIIAFLGLLALKVPNALALGLISGLLSLIPYIGIVLAAAVAMLQAIPQGALIVGLVAALFFIINQLQGNVLGPLIMGRTVALSASTILIALLIGLAVAGPIGAILAIPMATLLKRWIERYWLTSAAYNGGHSPTLPPHKLE